MLYLFSVRNELFSRMRKKHSKYGNIPVALDLEENMNCKNCGHPLKAGDTFCAYCGAKNEMISYEGAAAEPTTRQSGEVSEQTNGGNVKTKKKKKNSKVKLAIVLIVLVLVLGAALTVMIMILADKKLKEPIVIDLNNYVSTNCLASEGNPYQSDTASEGPVEVKTGFKNDSRGAGLIITGYNTYATIKQSDLSNVIKWSELLSDFETAIKQKKGYEKKTFGDYFKLSDFSFAVDKTDTLANEDIVKLTVKVNGKESFTFEDITIEFVAADAAVRIAGLTSVQAVDPFAYVELISEGANGEASLSIQVDEKLDQEIKGLKGYRVVSGSGSRVDLLNGKDTIASFIFSLGDNAYGSEHKNGEIVTMTCTCDETDELIAKHKIYIANFSKEYKLSGLGDYLTKGFKMSNDDFETFSDFAQKGMKEYFKNYSDISDISFENAYLCVRTDDSSYDRNYLYCIFSYDEKNYEDKIETRYAYIRFKDLTEFDGKITLGPDKYYDTTRDGYEKIEDITDDFGSQYAAQKVK